MEFLGKALKFGERATLENIEANEGISSLKTENILFNKEKEVIESKIDTEKITSKNKDQMWQELENKIKTTYCNLDPYKEYSTLAPDLGIYVDKIPSKGKIIAWTILLWIGLIAETFILVVQSILGGDFNPIILLYGALLGFGGFFIGHGLGDFIIEWDFRDLGQFKKEFKTSSASIIGIVVGLIIVSFVAFIRQLGLEEPSEKITAIGLTFVLAGMVAYLESMRYRFKKERGYYMTIVQKILQYIATKNHKEHLENYKARFYEGNQ